MTQHPFWPDDLPVNEAIRKDQQIVSHRQITDAYLLALAQTRGGTLATLDRGILLLPGAAGLVELLQEF